MRKHKHKIDMDFENSGIDSMDGMPEKFEAIAEKLTKIREASIQNVTAFKQLAAAMDGITNSFAQLGSGGKNPFSGLIKTAADGIKKLGALYISAGVAENIAIPGSGTSSMVGGAALEAAAGVAEAALTKMASGGLVSGSAFVNVGEYAGASHNPEVIAPLDKLQGMLNPLSGGRGASRFELWNDKLVAALDRSDTVNGFVMGFPD
jgi:hypothetical protein